MKQVENKKLNKNLIMTIFMCFSICIVFCACMSSTQIPGTRNNKGHGIMHTTNDNVVDSEHPDGSDVGQEKGQSTDKPENRDKKVAYLTFDDGPSVLTKDILDILKNEDVKATFFMIGEQINDETKETVERLCSEGHQIGVHTYCHEAGSIYCSAETYYSDVMKTQQILLQYTGETPLIYRFPWGSANGYIKGFRKEIVSKLSDLGMEYCDWNVSGEDSVGKTYAGKIINNVKKNYDQYNDPVILLHDSAAMKETVKALPTIIEMYKEAGYTFDIIKNREKPYQWKPYK